MGKFNGRRRARKEQRQKSAEYRQAQYDTMTPEKKLAELDRHHYRARSQRIKLKKEIDGAK